MAAVSGGPDSIFLLHRLLLGNSGRILVGHVNHGARGKASDKDQEFVERVSGALGLETATHRVNERKPAFAPGFEDHARNVRRKFLGTLSKESGAGKIATAHTADDQVESILMRFFEGAGIAGLKGIPRETGDGFVRPILDLWKEDILQYLKKYRISYRIDRSNSDTRFERNWVRHVLIPLLVDRYGLQVKKRIFKLGERFREIDEYLESEASKWMKRNIGDAVPETSTFRRKRFAALPTVLRIRVIQKICHDRLGISPNERLLASMDKAILGGGPSVRVKVGKGWELVNRYEEARFRPAGFPGKDCVAELRIEETGRVTPALAKRTAARTGGEVFDAGSLRPPLTVRPLRAGDRIRPFGGGADKKVKEILIDRKVPREERWGRPVVCDAEGTVLWIPGLIRSAHAPVTSSTKKTVLLKMVPPK